MDPRYRNALLLGVADDFRSPAPAAGLLPVPDGDDRVATIHHVAPGSLVGLLPLQPCRGIPYVAGPGPGQEAAELLLRLLGLEVLEVVVDGQWQRHLQPGVQVGQHRFRDHLLLVSGGQHVLQDQPVGSGGQHHLRDQPVGSLGQRRNHHQSQTGPRRDRHERQEPQDSLPDRLAQVVRLVELAVAGDPDPEGEGNAPVPARRLTHRCRFHAVTVLRRDPEVRSRSRTGLAGQKTTDRSHDEHDRKHRSPRQGQTPDPALARATAS